MAAANSIFETAFGPFCGTLWAMRVGSNVADTKRYVTAPRLTLEMYTVTVDVALVPVRLAVVDVALGEPLKLTVTGEPTGTLLPCTTTGMGSANWAGSKRSIELKLDPE